MVPLAGRRPGWNTVEVPPGLPPSDAVDVRFTGALEAANGISELHFVASPLPAPRTPRVVITTPAAADCVGNNIYVRGFVDRAGQAIDRVQLEYGPAQRELTLTRDGSFVSTIAGQMQLESIRVRAVVDGQDTVSSVTLSRCAPAAAPYAHTVADRGAPFGQMVRPESAATLEYGGIRIEIPVGAVEQPVRVTVHPVESQDVAAMDPGLTNVTAGGRAFRLGPHGLVFKKPIRLSIPWSQRGLPPGMREADVNAYFYDAVSRRWRDVPRVAIPGTERVLAATNHFTDYIAATRAMPETPQAGSFDANTIRGIRDANPLSGVATVSPPAANASGSATTSFPIQIPPGRNGIEPRLSLDYSSDQENGWVGVGWNLASSWIDVDTFHGVPTFALSDEETYRLDGQALLCTGPIRGDKNCTRRVDGRRDIIRRLGVWPHDLRWEIVREGVTYVYGQSPATRLTSPYTVPTGGAEAAPTVRWFLERVEDVHHNVMRFEYEPDNGTRPGVNGAAGEPFRQIYLKSIRYTEHTSGGMTDLYPNYQIDFIRGSRPDVISSARFGFEVLTRERLFRIDVKASSTLVRRYLLDYIEGDFGKSVLSSIRQQGTDGSQLFEYQFDYHRAPVTPEGGVQVGAGVPWTPSPVAGSLGSSSATRWGTNLWAGVGLVVAPISGGAGIGTSLGNAQSEQAFLDLNNDGLSDFLRIQHTGAAQWIAQLGTRTGTFLSQSLTYSLPTFSDDPSETASLNLGIQGPLGMAGFGLDASLDFSRARRGFFDADGDGWVDSLTVEPVGGSTAIAVRQNPFRRGRTSFGAGPGPNSPHDYLLTGLEPFAMTTVLPPAYADRFRPQLYSTAPIVRWVAPCAGFVRISGGVSRPSPQGNGVRASIFHGSTRAAPMPQQLFDTVWQRTVTASDGVCEPDGLTHCGGSGIVREVRNGDRLYFVVEGLGNIVGDDTQWVPNMEYLNFAPNYPEPRHVCSIQNPTYVGTCVGALREGDGYSSEGSWTPAPPTCTTATSPTVYNRQADFRVADHNATSWLARLKGTLQLSGSIHMTGPGTLRLVKRRWYFTNNLAATPPPEVPSPWDGVSQLNDTLIAQLSAAQTAAQFELIATVPLSSGVNSLAGYTVSVEEGTEIIAYVNVGSADPSIVQTFSVMASMSQVCLRSTPGAPLVCFDVGACAQDPHAPSGSQNTCALTGHPTSLRLGESNVRGMLVPAIGFQDLQLSRPESASFVGWYRGWSAIEWNDGNAFSEEFARHRGVGSIDSTELLQRITRLSASTPTTPAIPSPNYLPFTPAPLGTELQRPGANEAVTVPVWRGSGIDSYVSATTLKPSSRSKFRIAADGSLETISGYSSLASLGPSLRGASGAHLGLSINWGGIGGEGNRGEGRVSQEFYDVNGDRLPDSVTWTSAGMRVQFMNRDQRTFAPSVPFDLQFDSLRKSIDSSSRTSFSFGTMAGLAAPERRSEGLIEGISAPTPSFGFTEGRNATEVTLTDLNGDGLVDHVRLVRDLSDPLKP
ncbi:MAG: SpvB/TcaC N-terminal domain-containing protein, partial [Deltaproteobacteria bacterium]|nr:SpvB/TcaC N-terminal domain-containing protein [Deltaproteobacteria bacterium]